MKSFNVKFLFTFIVVFVFASLVGAPRVFASSILFQPSYSFSSSSSSNDIYYKIGTGFSQNLKSIQFRVKGGTAVEVAFQLFECSTSAYTNCDDWEISENGFSSAYHIPITSSFGLVGYSIVSNGVQSYLNAGGTSGPFDFIQMNPSKYYAVLLSPRSSYYVAGTAYWQGCGSSCSSYTLSNPPGGLSDPMLALFDSAGLLAVDNDIIAYSPVSGSTGLDANINFNGVYNNDGVFDTIIITLNDLTNSTSINFQCAIPSIGQNLNFSCNHIGKVSTSYSYNAILFDSSSGNVFPGGAIVDTTKTFSTGATLTGGGDFVGSTCNTLDIGCYIQNALGWFFTVSPTTLNNFSNLTLANSIPFSYVYDVGNLYNELFANGGSMDYTVSVNTGALGTVTFISPTLISNVPYSSTIKTLLGYILYFMTAMTLYYTIRNVFNQNHA